ncbi:MAG: hypothetical protein ACI391_00265, partial [Muribaculaceae bacterium]
MFHKRPAAGLMVVAAAVAMLLAHLQSDPVASQASLIYSTPLVSSGWAIVVNGVLLLGTMGLMVLINRQFNILRAVSYLNVGLLA